MIMYLIVFRRFEAENLKPNLQTKHITPRNTYAGADGAAEVLRLPTEGPSGSETEMIFE